jgi:hypothetical protein
MQRAMVVVTLFAVGIIFSVSVPEGHTKAVKGQGGHEIHLSKKLRRILSAEMNAIQNGMANLVIAIPAGHWNDIVETAKKMKGSYIMNKKLSKEQMREFYRSLPSGYKEIDREFYETVGEMIHAAKEHNGERINFHFYKLNESCIKCHSKYAKKRFPNFK